MWIHKIKDKRIIQQSSKTCCAFLILIDIALFLKQPRERKGFQREVYWSLLSMNCHIDIHIMWRIICIIMIFLQKMLGLDLSMK